MNSLEKMVWAAAFANQFNADYQFYEEHPELKRGIDGINGYDCAGVADVAIEKLREAFAADPDSEHLLPLTEDKS